MFEEEFESAGKIYTLVVDFFVNYSFQVIGAILIFILGLLVARWIAGITLRLCERHDVDVTLRLFIASTVRLLVVAMVIVICLGKFGISVAPFVAAIGAISLSIGLALQGVFSNYGAGFTIVLTRPFVVGNTICINGISGVVEEIRLSYTVLTNEDGEKITIPNKHIVGEVITNSYTNRVVEACVGISYDSDPRRASELIRTVIGEIEGVTVEPAPQVGIETFGDFSINIGYRYWVPTRRYFELQYQVNQAIFDALAREGIQIPYPIVDLRRREA
ncbi:mechanosensitive ion channel protein [Marinobacterium nitratireducens]|uniref:Small-conductance mechanosensitive channel n=1 Tax=Marinobacterium nitratireducens TaxID=518897 RepID=A0A917Z6Y6_9GAMM|nr:mechanosensitive ion channel family protein [Marinobacterium nitratireducens]GGO75745.1 mechanosensitive ion channel protein [Marinobacterium nitratireducens]